MVWKISISFFAFTFMASHIVAEIPSYIHVCGRQNPNIDKCIYDSISDLKDLICKGIPELDSPPLDPFYIDRLAVSEAENAKLYLDNLEINGLCDYNLNFFHADFDKFHFYINVSFNHATVNGTYDFDVRILVPFAQQGLFVLTLDDVAADINLDLKMVNRAGKKYVHISKIKILINIITFDHKFGNNENESSQLNEILSSLLGNNKQEFINKIKPLLEKEIAKKVIMLANNIVNHFSYDELFPDRP